MLQTQTETQTSKEVIKEQLEKTKATVEWECLTPNEYYALMVKLLGEKNYISGRLSYYEPGSALIYIDMFHVDEKMRQMGVGTKLIKSFIAEAMQYGAKILKGHVTSESALRTRARVFGSENLQFFIHGTDTRKDISYEEALVGNFNFDVVVDLTKINTQDWEKPIRIT